MKNETIENLTLVGILLSGFLFFGSIACLANSCQKEVVKFERETIKNYIKSEEFYKPSSTWYY